MALFILTCQSAPEVERIKGLLGCDILPVKSERQQSIRKSGGSGISCQANNVPKALIAVGAAEEVRDDIDGPAWGALRREADDADTVEEWEYV